MINIANINAKDRQALFRNTAAKTGLTEGIVEKDFWVCFMLRYLFHISKFKDSIAFKGGTSLSKSYGLIKRFSEDIDLILDWRVLGFDKDEPWLTRSNTKQDRFNKEANRRTGEYLKDEFLPCLSDDLRHLAETPIKCHIDDVDPQTIIVIYDKSFEDHSILPVIRLEIGALAAWTPATQHPITPYAAEAYPHLFRQPSADIPTVLPERTFWEKVTILHREANRPEGKAFPSRYSRHYYDLYAMAASPVKERAFADRKLLDKVVRFKEKFYRCPWAKYEEAKIGSMKLTAPEGNLKALKEDYEHMQNMIFGEKPTFEELLKGLSNLEEEINRLPEG